MATLCVKIRPSHSMASLPACTASDRRDAELRGQRSHGRSRRRRRARASGREREGRLRRTWAEERERPRAGSNGARPARAWSLAAAGASESSAAPAGSPEASRWKERCQSQQGMK